MARANSTPQVSTQPPPAVSPLREFYLPLIIILGLVAVTFSPRMQQSDLLLGACWAAAGCLALWLVVLALRFRNAATGPTLSLALRKQHYIQALVQISVFVYWGYYWEPVYDHAVLIVAQLLFAYGVDLLLNWSRRGHYVVGFGPFPIIFSINLFLWFRDDWFYLQFMMIAVGVLGKEYVRWQRDGRSTHVFNPSAFSLGVFSLLLIVTQTTELTWGPEIASTLTLAPHIYLFLFAAGLVVMYFFAITLVAATAAATLFGLSALYSAWTGVPYFVDSEIPAAVFLGLHLLITDPSTSPRTALGKGIFGALYGVGVFALYALLGALGAPTFYDKLLCVPLLNLSVIVIDHFVRRVHRQAAPAFAPGRANVAMMAVWVLFFGTMALLGRTDGRHPGDSLPFWQQACNENRNGACAQLVQLEATYCNDRSAWACNELGNHYRRGELVSADDELAYGYFARACELRFQPACLNLLDDVATHSAAPRELDLRLLLREGGGNLMALPVPDLYRRACDHGWDFACERTVSAR